MIKNMIEFMGMGRECGMGGERKSGRGRSIQDEYNYYILQIQSYTYVAFL